MVARVSVSSKREQKMRVGEFMSVQENVSKIWQSVKTHYGTWQILDSGDFLQRQNLVP